MSEREDRAKTVCFLRLTSFVALVPMLAACGQEASTAAPEARPVRTVTIEKRQAGMPITLTGRIEAEDEVAIAFRIAGRLPAERPQARGSRDARTDWWRVWNRRTS